MRWMMLCCWLCVLSVQAADYQLLTRMASPGVEAKLPDLSHYTEAAIRQRLVTWYPRQGHAELERLIGKVESRKFFSAGRLSQWSMRQGQFPRIVMLRKGLMTLRQLSKAQPEAVVSLGHGRYLARLPLGIAADAALVIEQGETLRLSEERGAFLINAGEFYLLHGALTGWRETQNQQATFVNKAAFRPFYTAWSSSRTYMFGSTVSHLGSASSKAYGLTLSTYTEADEAFAPMTIDRHQSPRGWLIGNRFEDLFYGFYCYEANGVVVVGNEYVNNIYYGIDPHDRSHGLIIAENHVWGSRIRHGIIVSRDVSDSFIFRNVSHDNAKAGIMLDRQSNRNVVAQNVSYQNGSDGIVLYESDDNLIWANQVYHNANHGIRFRNSRNVHLADNVVVANGRFGIYGHLRDLDKTGRDLKQDPYQRRISGLLQGGLVAMNHSGAVFVDQPDYLRIQAVAINPHDASTPKSDALEGMLAQHRAEILSTLRQPGQQIELQPASSGGSQQGGH